MLTVACVLRAGPEYRSEHVAQLRDGVAKHLSLPHLFVCLSDVDVPCERIPLMHRWPGYWSKIELFRPDLFDSPVLYIDLDSVIVGPINGLVAGHRFTMLRDFYWPEHLASGVMAWNCDLSVIYNAFVQRGAEWMKARPTKGTWGDQGFIAKHSPVSPDRWQNMHPGRVVSYKVHVRRPQNQREIGNGKVPDGASVVCFHGKPRPWQIEALI